MSTETGVPANKGVPAHSSTARKSWMWVSVALASLLGVGLFAGTAGAILYNDLNAQVATSVLDTSALKDPQSAQSAEPPVTDSFAGRDVNILLMGIDSRQDQSDQIINPGDDDPTIRSDTTLLLNIAADRQHINVISIPRDMWVVLPECQRSDGSISEEQWGQFNWAFSYGSLGEDLAGGVNCTEALVESLTGVTSDGFAVIDFKGFTRMIEALGGVEICLDEPIDDPEYLQLQLPAGCQRLEPYVATQFARVRYTGDGSDMGRIQRQHQLLAAMVTEALDQNLLTDMPKLYAFLSTALDATRLSPSLANLKTDAGLASSIKNTPRENIRFLTMPVVTADFDANRLLPKEPTNTELWQAIINGTDLPVGTVFSNLDGEFFTVGENGELIPGGDPRTDDEIGSLDGWYSSDQEG